MAGWHHRLNEHEFSTELALCITWPTYWSFNFSISSFNEYSGLISFRVDWFDFLAVQENLKSLFQHHSSKPSIVHHSAFFIVQLSHPYTTLEKNTALTRQTFVSRVTSLLLNMLPRLVMAFLSRNKRLLISWLQSPSAVILEAPEIVHHCFHCFPIYLANAMSFIFFNDNFEKIYAYLFWPCQVLIAV